MGRHEREEPPGLVFATPVTARRSNPHNPPAAGTARSLRPPLSGLLRHPYRLYAAQALTPFTAVSNAFSSWSTWAGVALAATSRPSLAQALSTPSSAVGCALVKTKPA